MSLGAMDIKVILSLLAIMTAAAVALICDYRRTRVFKLREAMVELKVRQVEVSRSEPKAAPKSKPLPDPRPAPSPAAQAIKRAVIQPSSPPPAPDLAPEEAGLEFAPPPRSRRRAPLPAPEPLEKESSKEALSSWLIQRAIARAAEKAKADERIEPKTDPNIEPAPPNPQPGAPLQPVVVDESLLRSLFSEQPQLQTLPTGFHPKSALARLPLHLAFTGFVAAVGVPSPRAAEDVKSLLIAAMSQTDFCCRTQDDEFLLFCPNVSGAESQRRLGALSAKLWDLSPDIALGGADVQDEALGYAVSAAKERMLQGRRTHRANAMAD